MEPQSDEAGLIERSRRGDLNAFNALVERYQRSLYNLCLRTLGSAQPAEDATQEAFIAAYRSIGAFRGGGFRSWLFRIGVNACYDELRRRRARPAVSLDAPEGGDGSAQEVASPGATPEERAQTRELGDLLREALSRIPGDQRVAIVLADVQGMDYAEIARVMGVSLGTVKSRISRGRAALREILRERGELLPARFRQVSEGT